MPVDFQNKPSPPSVSINPENKAEVQRLLAGDYLDRMGQPNFLEPAWGGIAFAILSFRATARYAQLARDTRDVKTRDALANVSQYHASNAIYRLRAVARFLENAALVAAYTTPPSVAGTMSEFFANFGRRVDVVASSLVMHYVDRWTGDTCNNYSENDPRKNCKWSRHRNERDAVVNGIARWEFPLPSERLRVFAPEAKWPTKRVAPDLYTDAWFAAQKKSKEGAFLEPWFLNAGYEQILNLIASVQAGKASSIQDPKYKQFRGDVWDMLSMPAHDIGSLKGVNVDIATRLWYCFSFSWTEVGLAASERFQREGGRKLDRPLSGADGESSKEAFPWGLTLAVAGGIGVCAWLLFSTGRNGRRRETRGLFAR